MEREADVQKFLQYLQRRFANRRTSKDYMSDVRQFMAHCEKGWRDVTMQDIDAFIDHQRQAGLKAATLKRRAAALKTFFDFLAEDSDELGWLNPVRMKRHAGKQARHLPRDLSEDRLQQLWNLIDKRRDQAWFVLMLRGGLRVGEVVALKIEDILAPAQSDQPARLRVQGKGEKERIVLLTEDAYAVVQAWLQERPASQLPNVFLNERDGGALSTSGIEYCLRQYGRRLGLHIHPHQLRHSYARQLTEAGMPLSSLAKRMGHAQLTTTQVYTAGADPALAQAYQQAMAHLQQLPLPPAQAPADPPPVPVQENEPSISYPEIDWAQWLTDLPEPIRQVCLAYVQPRYPTWKPRNRCKLARDMLIELRQFWTWRLAQSPIQRPEQLRLEDVQAYQRARDQETVKHTSVDRPISLLINLYRELADQGREIDARLFRWQPRPRPDYLPRDLAEADMRRLESWMAQGIVDPDPSARLASACFFLMAHAGLRAGECLDLTWQDLDLPNRRLLIRQGKGQRDRVVYCSDVAVQALNAYLQSTPRPPQAPLFVGHHGQPITYHWLYLYFQVLAKAMNLSGFTLHRLRHTFATRLLNAGMDVTRIQKLLGHEHLNTTMIYARVLDVTLEADYRQAMRTIELHQMPLSDQPIRVDAYPIPGEVIDVR